MNKTIKWVMWVFALIAVLGVIIFCITKCQPKELPLDETPNTTGPTTITTSNVTTTTTTEVPVSSASTTTTTATTTTTTAKQSPANPSTSTSKKTTSTSKQTSTTTKKIKNPEYGTTLTINPYDSNIEFDTWGWKAFRTTYTWMEDEYGGFWGPSGTTSMSPEEVKEWSKFADPILEELRPTHEGMLGESYSYTIWVWLKK